MSKVRRVLFIPDTHIPYHDRRAYSLMLDVAEEAKVTEIVILGDWGEYYFAASHDKTPNVEKNGKWEIRELIKHANELDERFPKATKIYIEGNHEQRLQRYMAGTAPEIEGLPGTTTQELLGLKARGWKWIPYGPQQLYRVANSALYARHEPYGGGTHVAHGTVVKAGCSVIFGHVHRIQESQVVMANGANHRGITPGWLGDKSHPVYGYVKGHHQWALGFGIADILENGTFFHHTIHIIDYQCAFDGHIWGN